MAFTLFPAGDNGGEITAIPIMPGTTAMMPPPTPDFAGRPVAYNHWPESSYKPAVAITGNTYFTVSGLTTVFLVTGLCPPLASVAAITARSFALTAIAHCLV